MTSLPMVLVALFVRASRVGRTLRQQSRSRFFPLALMPKPATRNPLGKIPAEPVYHGDREEKRRSCQNRRAALGKFQWETVYHGVHAFFRWRSRQSRRRAGENSIRNPFIMAIAQEKAAITPKPATHGRFGENRMGTRLSWRSPKEKATVTPKPATRDPFGEIPSGIRLSWRSPRKAPSGRRNLSDW